MPDDDRATPPGDDQPPALPAPGDRGDDESRGRPDEGRAIRSYSPIERAGLKWLAVRDGVSATADAHGVPRSTLTGWLEETGGVGAVQDWLIAETAGRFLAFEQSMYDWAIKQIESDHANHEQAWVTVRKLIDARIGVLAVQPPDGQPAVAAAKATVELHVTEVDGKISVIDLGVPPEDEQGEPGYESA